MWLSGLAVKEECDGGGEACGPVCFHVFVPDECACGEVLCVPAFADDETCDGVLIWLVGSVEFYCASIHVEEV